MLHALAANIEAASTAAAAGGPVLDADVFDAADDCTARGTDNMQMRFASGLPHASICATGNVPVGPSRFIHVEQRRDRAARPDRPCGHARAEPRRGNRRDPGHVSVRAFPRESLRDDEL